MQDQTNYVRVLGKRLSRQLCVWLQKIIWKPSGYQGPPQVATVTVLVY